MPRQRKAKLVPGRDYVHENGVAVLTREYLLTLGQCCGKQCPRCPYECDGSIKQHPDATPAHHPDRGGGK